MSVILTKKNMREAAALAHARSVAAAPHRVAVAAATAPPVDDPKPDDALTRIMKMLPGEATAAYTASKALATAGSGERYGLPIAFVLCLCLVVLILRRAGEMHTPPVKPEPKQYVFQVLAFIAWAFAIQNPFEGVGLVVPPWVPTLAIIFVPIFGSFAIRDPDATSAPVTSAPGG